MWKIFYIFIFKLEKCFALVGKENVLEDAN